MDPLGLFFLYRTFLSAPAKDRVMADGAGWSFTVESSATIRGSPKRVSGIKWATMNPRDSRVIFKIPQGRTIRTNRGPCIGSMCFGFTRHVDSSSDGMIRPQMHVGAPNGANLTPCHGPRPRDVPQVSRDLNLLPRPLEPTRALAQEAESGQGFAEFRRLLGPTRAVSAAP